MAKTYRLDDGRCDMSGRRTGTDEEMVRYRMSEYRTFSDEMGAERSTNVRWSYLTELSDVIHAHDTE